VKQRGGEQRGVEKRGEEKREKPVSDLSTLQKTFSRNRT
jgi:hypothetical protein